MSDEVVLSCDNVSRTFVVGAGFMNRGRAFKAVDRVSLSIRRGETLAIVGESGSGKTTLARMLLGVLPPSEGTIAIGGKPIDGYDRLSLARVVQPIFQDPYSSLNPRKTVEQIIEAPLIVHGTAAADRTARVRRMMDSVGLSLRLIHSYGNQLSGGQRQRVAIARALVMQPAIVVCDEPTSALDVSVQAQILNLLVDLRQEFNLTYVFISHDLGVVDYIAADIAVMYLGQVIEYGKAANVLRHPQHPYTKVLLGSVLSPDPDQGLPDVQMKGGFPDIINPPSGCRFHPRCPSSLPLCAVEEPAARVTANGMAKCVLVASGSHA